MLHIVRQLRRRLLIGNRFSKYLLYAFGEILLVVLGILIAIQVDNRNEERIRRTKIDQVLIELLTELEYNIDMVERKIANYQVKDSLSYLVFNRQLTLDDYLKKDNDPRLYYIPNRYDIATLKQNAVDKLMVFLDNFPSEFQGILTRLDEVQQWGGMIEQVNARMTEFSKRYIYHLTDNYPWYGDHMDLSQNMDYLDYMINDYFYTNTIKSYRIFAFGNHAVAMNTYKLYAVLCYKEIAKQLGLTDRLGRYNVDAAISEIFLGRWKSADGNVEMENTLLDGLLHRTTTTSTNSEKDRYLNIVSSKALKDGQLIRTASWNSDPAIQYTTEIIKQDTLRILSNTREDVFYKMD